MSINCSKPIIGCCLIIPAPIDPTFAAATSGDCLSMILLAYNTRYSKTPEQRTLWEQYKFKSFVLCREVVLFSEVQNVLELYTNQLFGTLKSVLCRGLLYCVPISEGPLSEV